MTVEVDSFNADHPLVVCPIAMEHVCHRYFVTEHSIAGPSCIRCGWGRRGYLAKTLIFLLSSAAPHGADMGTVERC